MPIKLMHLRANEDFTGIKRRSANETKIKQIEREGKPAKIEA